MKIKAPEMGVVGWAPFLTLHGTVGGGGGWNISWYFAVFTIHNTIQYNTIQYNTIQYNTIQYNTIQYNTIQYNTIQYNTIQYNTIQQNTIQHNTIQYKYEYYSSGINLIEFEIGLEIII